MKTLVTKKYALALIIGITVASSIGYVLTREGGLLHAEHSHQIGTSHDDEVHVHADIKMYVNDERIRFTDAKYQSDSGHIRHATLHFHEGNDNVIHRHADGVTLVEFFKSIGITITNDCLTLDTGTEYCTNNSESLQFFVNGAVVSDITDYITQEEDRILIYFGEPQNPNLESYKNTITDEACLYSGTCPERGTPPTEGCGLTCDVINFEDEPAWWQIWK